MRRKGKLSKAKIPRMRLLREMKGEWLMIESPKVKRERGRASASRSCGRAKSEGKRRYTRLPKARFEKRLKVNLKRPKGLRKEMQSHYGLG